MKPTVICMVPARNEAWVLPHFLECASSWADIIIVGDHNSTDRTASIARRYEKVRLISLAGIGVDRRLGRKTLLNEARKIPGERLIFSIDADEMISANWSSSPEWAQMLDAPAGTRFQFEWLHILPGLGQAAVSGKVVVFKDDGSEYVGGMIKNHEHLIPDTNGELIRLRDIKLLHYIMIEPERMFSKHRWNKCLEIVEMGKRPWDICIMYQDTKIKHYGGPIVPVKESWLNGYEWLNEYRHANKGQEGCYWYDQEVLDYFDKYGTDRFRKLNIWQVDWGRKAQLLGRTGNYSDPRSRWEMVVHQFIEQHRESLKTSQNFKWRVVRRFGKTVLNWFGW